MESGGSALIWTITSLGLAALELAIGAGIGWWLRGRRSGNPDNNPEVQRARAAMAKLHELAASMAADVGQHTTQVQAISDELNSLEGEGNADLESAVVGTVAKILQANNRLERQLATAEVRLQEQAHEIEARAADALTDALTGRPNRRAFDHELERRLVEWQRRQTPVSLMIIDIDHFKKFNDTHGHLAGDAVLCGVTDVLHRSMRDLDLVARYGGEEFGIIMPATPLDTAMAVVERVRTSVAATMFRFGGNDLKVTISEGVAQAMAGDTQATLIKRADEALYAAKKAGRNRAFFHDGTTCRSVNGNDVPRPQAATPAPAETTPKVAPPGMPERTKAAAEKPTGAASEQPTKVAAPTEVMPSPRPATAEQHSAATEDKPRAAQREAYVQDVRRRVAESNRCGTRLALMLVRLDNLSELSRDHGPAAVAAIQRAMDQFLSAAIREMDLVARSQDDCYSVMLPGTPLRDAAQVAERLRKTVAGTPLKAGQTDLSFTVSIGVAEATSGDNFESLLRRAEATLHAASEAGRNRTFVCHDGALEPIEALAVAK